MTMTRRFELMDRIFLTKKATERRSEKGHMTFNKKKMVGLSRSAGVSAQ
jgi:hypothetical protein